MLMNLQEENEQLRERISLALLGYHAGIYEWNMLDDSAYYSPEWKLMLGLEGEDIVPNLSTWANLVYPGDLVEVMEHVENIIHCKEKEIETVHRLRHKNGNFIWILGRGLISYDENGNPYRMVGIHTDITEQKQQQLELKYLAQMVEQTHDSIISTDLLGNILTWNKGSELLFGYDEKMMIGKHINFLQDSEDDVNFNFHINLIKQEEQIHTEITFRDKNNKLLYIDLSLSMFKDEMNEPIGIIGYLQDITVKKKLEFELTFKANYDALTKLPNRILFNDRLKQILASTDRNKKLAALFFIDLDNFKHINDTYGHDIGDEVLKVVANSINQELREEDTISRLGGDEFTIIIGNLKEKNDASILAEKILTVLDRELEIEDYRIQVSSSIGISIYPNDTTTSEKLLKFADMAMYKVKTSGRNNYQYYSST